MMIERYKLRSGGAKFYRHLGFRCLLYNQHGPTISQERNKLSRFWVPTGGIAANDKEDSHAKLIRAGLVRQAHSGIYHLLPLGRRIQDKCESLIDKFMTGLGSSRLALSAMSSEEIWSKSRRFDSAKAEASTPFPYYLPYTDSQTKLFRFSDKKGAKYILSPTHEEEITILVANTTRSYKDFPLRLYQTTRKYRDELRPRHGLLRSREFVMSDLYTFDYNLSSALATYEQVRGAFSNLFRELKIPFLVAEADSGNMGGNLSHEFHFPSSKGEDNVISCSACAFVANEEVAESRATLGNSAKGGPETWMSESNTLIKPTLQSSTDSRLVVWRGLSQDKQTLVNVWYVASKSKSESDTQQSDVNVHAVRKVVPQLDPSIPDLNQYFIKMIRAGKQLPFVPNKIINLIDYRASLAQHNAIHDGEVDPSCWPADMFGDKPEGLEISAISKALPNGRLLDVLRMKTGDACPRCPTGTISICSAIELGHTFHLGTRYSQPLKAMVDVPTNSNSEGTNVIPRMELQVPLQMGCHGIGVSRMIGAVADILADEQGLNWPRVLAPFEIIVIARKGLEPAACEVYDKLSSVPSKGHGFLDVVLDDRQERSVAWKLKDADLIGYPIVVVVGRGWTRERHCEIQCRRLEFNREVRLENIYVVVDQLLGSL